jgi:hypothetical protein
MSQDENLDVIYINNKINREEWHTFEVGKTKFNDEALRQASMYFTFPSLTLLPSRKAAN